MKDRDGNVVTDDRSLTGRWKEYFEELMNEENGREQRVEEVTVVDQEVTKVSQGEMRRTFKRMKGGKTVGPEEWWKLD